MESQKHSVLKRMVLKFDKYGLPLNLTFNGKKSYQSSLGFALTSIQLIIVLLYLAFQIITVMNRTDIKIYSQESYLADDRSRIANISSKEFGLTYRIQYYGPNVSWQADEVYTLFSPILTNDFLNGTKIYEKFSMIPPDENTFTTQNYPAASLGVWEGNGAIFTSQSVLKGNLKLEILYCQQEILDKMFPGRLCKSEAESLLAMTGVQIYIDSIYQYFDSTNFTHPLKWKTSLDGFGLSPSFSHARVVMLREKYIKLRDNLFSTDFGEQKLKYYQFQPSVASSYYVNDITYKKRMVSMNILLDDSVETTIREVRNYGQALSAVGGVIGLLTAINLTLINFFVRSEMDIDLISTSFKQRSFQSDSLSRSDQIKNLFSNNQNKVLTLKDSILLKITATCPFCRSRNLIRKHKLYESAISIISQEISIQNLIRISRMIKLMSKVLLPKPLRIVTKQLLVKDLKHYQKDKDPSFLLDSQIMKVVEKKKPIYRRFFKYALGYQIYDNSNNNNINNMKRNLQLNKPDHENIEEYKLDNNGGGLDNSKVHNDSKSKLNMRPNISTKNPTVNFQELKKKMKKKILKPLKGKRTFGNQLPLSDQQNMEELDSSQRKLNL